jgi:hypothetical protein
MRYVAVPTYNFTDTTGKTVVMKEMREIENLSIGMTLNHAADEDFDEIASRNSVYGEGGERDSYKLHEANIVAILDAAMDYSKLSSIKVPT